MWRKQFRNYMRDPHAAWPVGRQRQADKLLEAGHPTRKVMRLARRRARRGSATLFVVNCGSSGSWWLTTMLSELPRFEQCGEVYLPPSLVSDMNDWPPKDRIRFIDCVHLSHVATLGRPTVKATLVNSAHKSGWRLASMMEGSKVVLLVRDPVDIVLSRTWRKPVHRDEIAPDADDRAFLEENIEFVRDFFARVADHDLLVRYEDMVRDAAGVVSEVCAAVGHEPADEEIEAAAAKHRRGSSTTNAYQGPKVEVPDHLRAHAETRLADIRSQYGYASRSSS